MAAVLDGVKNVEVAGWTFVPAGGGVLPTGAPMTTGSSIRRRATERGLSIGTVGAKAPAG